MSLSIFFQPLSEELQKLQLPETVGSQIDAYYDHQFPDWEDADVILFGVQEDRASDDNIGAAHAPNIVREELYQLYFSDEVQIADLGNVVQGKEIPDTYVAIETIVFEILKKGKTLLFIGGSRDLSFAAYKAYGRLEQTVNFCALDARLNMGEYTSNVSPTNYINHIVLHQPNYLFNYSVMGYQTYLVPSSEIQLMNDLYFDHHRLGEIQADLRKAEPIIRYADLMSVNMNVVRYSEIGLERNDASPNGFYGEQICQLMRYAGISDKLSCIGLFDYNPILNESKIGARLMGQMIWCFLEGFAHRKKDFPAGSKSNYKKYTVVVEGGEHTIHFLKSDKSERWWMQVPYPPDKRMKFERHHLIPCSYEDYQMAGKGLVPDLWWQTYQKLR